MEHESHKTLDPPSKDHIEDSGAHDLEQEASDSDDHFSDAQSGLEQSALNSPTNALPTLAIPDIHHIQDTEDHEILISPNSRPTTPGGQPIPITVVEKLDPESPSHGDVPGTPAHEMRAADAVPDIIMKASDHTTTAVKTRSRAISTPGDLPIPSTRVERVDSSPSYGEVPGTAAFELRKEDALPDVVEEVGDVAGESISNSLRSTVLRHSRRKSSVALRKGSIAVPLNYENGMTIGADDNDDNDGFGDFDDFEEGEEGSDFGDFDDGFQEPAFATAPQQSIPISPSFPVLNFEKLNSPGDIFAAVEPYMEALFPPDAIDTSILPPLTSENPVFLTPRSASLWSQLVAPPPLQPPNWIRSRIRRLFLVSLGVPVDLDEILPASKQKKLILPSIHLNPSSGFGDTPRGSSESRGVARVKQSEGESGSTTPTRSESRRRKGPPPAPNLDLVSARQLCEMTPEAMDGLTTEELKVHTKKLEKLQELAKEVLDYWTKMTDEKLGDREAFEGVIENLVKHARKVRK